MAEPFDALAVLGCTAAEAEDWLRGRRVTPGEVEAAAARHYRWRSHLHDESSYWVTIGQAAQILGRTRAEVVHLVETRRLPSIKHVSGTRLLRRDRVMAMVETSGRGAERTSSIRSG
jgi:hypothetical protein